MHAMPSPSILRATSQPTLSRWCCLPSASTTRATISDLTEENLEEHNSRHQYLVHDKISKSSPYYKGLIDASLSLNRHKLTVSSPDRESHATTNATSCVLIKLQEWGSCFTYKSKNNNYPESADPPPPPPVVFGPNSNEREAVQERENTVKLVVEEEKPKFIWADMYRPTALEDFICNRDKALQLQIMVKSGECGHFIFEGPAGVGKRTMVCAFLRETFGPDNIKTWEECQQFDLKGESVNLKKSSQQYVEVNIISDLKGYEKHVIVELIKEQHNRVVQYGQDCRAIILYEADKLSTDVHLYISWQLENYKLGYNKLFFCCSDASKLQPIKSFCTIVQLLPPSNEEIVQVLEFIAKQEAIDLPHWLAKKIAQNSQHNLRQAIRSLEASSKIK